MRRLQFVLILLAVGAFASPLLALRRVYTGPVGGNPKWPDGLKELANRSNRVHGFLVNGQDVFFYTGDARSLNNFLTQYAKLKRTNLQLVIHPGPKKATSSFSNKPELDRLVDWSLYTSMWPVSYISPFTRAKPSVRDKEKFVTCIDVWVGGLVKLDEVKVPINIEVRSGSEIETFVAEHKKKRAKVNNDTAR